jgi:hypothetical protein
LGSLTNSRPQGRNYYRRTAIRLGRYDPDWRGGVDGGRPSTPLLREDPERDHIGLVPERKPGDPFLTPIGSKRGRPKLGGATRKLYSTGSSGAEIGTTKYLQRLQRCRRRLIHLCVNVRTARPLPHIAQTPQPQQNRTTLPTSSPIERPQRPLLPWTGGGQLALTGSPASASAHCYLFPKLIKADV